ncbi:MAG TPA: DinB family protein [Acidimicrobiales bacterium]|jgi:hypothetical protein
MTADAMKAALQMYLDEGRHALLLKLEGLGEYDLRRPLTPTGTNLLGVVKHVATMEALYFGACFGRPFPQAMPWIEDGAEPNADFWATPEESSGDILRFYEAARAHSDATIAELDLGEMGTVSWWSVHQQPLGKIVVHMVAETHRHVGHADIVRESIDGATGFLPGDDCLPAVDGGWWTTYRERLEEVARQAAQN